MDFRGRSNQSVPAAPTQPVNRNPVAPTGNFGSQFAGIHKQPMSKVFQLGAVILLFSVTSLVVALTFLLVFGGNSQEHSIQKNKYQAVFLNNGQVYFGNVQSIGSKTIDLRNIYYLQTNGTAGTDNAAAQSANNVSLVKLGCELHAPYDQMLVNSDQVIFWENLQDTSQVVQAITKYKKDNAKQTCTQQSNSTQQSPSTTSNPTATPTPTTTPTTIKKP